MADTHEVPPDAPIVCTIQPGDDERTMMETYRALFAESVFVGGERTGWGVRWRFRDQDGIEKLVRDQAEAERRCCAFLRMAVTVADGMVVWDVIGPANAAAFLDEYAELPTTAFGNAAVPREQVITSGLVLDDQCRERACHGEGAPSIE